MQQGERREGIVIRLVRGATIKGRVLDAKGGPVANATVQPDPASLTSNGAASIFLSVMMQNMRRDIREAKTDAEGKFSMPEHALGLLHAHRAASRIRTADDGVVRGPGLGRRQPARHPDVARGDDQRPREAARWLARHEGDGPGRAGRRRPRTSRVTAAPTPNADGRFEVTGLARRPVPRRSSRSATVSPTSGRSSPPEEPQRLHSLRG